MKTVSLFVAWALLGQAAADPNPGHLKMALVNLKCVPSAGSDAEANKAAIQANLNRHLYFIDRLASEGAEFIGFPELSINGYDFSKNSTWLSIEGPEVQILQKAAADKRVYIAAGLAEQDPQSKRWNTHLVIDPKGKLLGSYHKICLTKEQGFVEKGSEHPVFEVKGVKMGITICADGSDRKNLEALVQNGAAIIYGPHANTTGGTTAGWYKFRSAWGGPEGWIAQMKVSAALHNHAGLYNPEFQPPPGNDANSGWASGAWFIGPDGRTLAQMPPSSQRADSKEHVIVCNVPLTH